MPPEMPPAGYVTDYLLFWYVAATLWIFARALHQAAQGRRGRRIGSIVLGTLAVAATLVLGGETYYRYVHDEPADGTPSLTDRAWHLRHWQGTLNEHGFRGPPLPQAKTNDVYRILLLGDDAVAGRGIERLEDRLGERLAARPDVTLPGKRQEWLTVARRGWSTGHQLAWLRENAGDLLPDRVLLLYRLDDTADLLESAVFDRRRASNARPGWINPARSFLWDVWWTRHRAPSDDRADRAVAAYDEPGIWGRQTARLNELSAVCAAHGARLDVLLLPRLSEWGPQYSHGALHDRIARTLRTAGAHVHDLREALNGYSPGDLLVSDYAQHPNETAHELIARAIAGSM